MLILRIILLLVVSGGALFTIRSIDAASEPQIGPYTEIQLPLEDLPALPEDQVYNPVVELTSGEPIRRPSYDPDGNPLPDDHSLDTLATSVAWHSEEELTRPYLQVLYVLDDPREVPLARYAYNSEDGVVLPVDDMEQLARQNLKTINVYVKIQNFSNQPLVDPLLASEFADSDWPALYVSPLNIELEGISQFPCAAVEYADGTEPYLLPAIIDGDRGVGGDGLYDPAAYAPPRPWYYGEESALQPGEAREGWVSCLAPDVPLEQLQVKAKYRYTGEPGVVTFDLYKPGVFFPDHELLASIDLTLADLPGTVSQCDELEYCASSCPKAYELGVKQGVCAARVEGNGDISTIYGFRINNYDEPVQRSFLVWTYTSANSFPVSVIRLDDVPLNFYYENSPVGNIATFGSVTFYSPRIEGLTEQITERVLNEGIELDEIIVDESEAVVTPTLDPQAAADAFRAQAEEWNSITHLETREVNIYFLVSRVVIEPYGITAEKLQGYQRVVIGASARAYVERNGVVLSAGANLTSDYSLDISRDINPDTGTIEGTIYKDLGEGLESVFEEEFSSPLLPNTALLNIHSNYEKASFSNKPPGIYPASVVTIYQPDSALVSKSEMCDVVDCIEYIDEDDTYHHDVQDDHVPKPARSVPVMCAGEWANNVIVDDLNVVKYMEYIGRPLGLGTQVTKYFKELYNSDQYTHIFFYNLQIMGGAAPWWNVIDRGRYKNLFGETVDLYTGRPTSRRVHIIGYYSLIDKANLSKGYFVPSYDYEYRGWMGEIIDKKVLAFNLIGPSEEFGENINGYKSFSADDAGFLFMQEGPIWTTSCQRDLLPGLSEQEMYAPQVVSSSVNVEEDAHDMSSLLPGMSYPQSLPYVDGKNYSMGEYGDTYPDNNLRLTVKAVETLPGKPDNPAVYVPSEDKFYPADEKVTRNNKLFFSNNNAFVIPPDTTYIRVKIGVDYVGNGEGEDRQCQITYDDFRLIYPGYLPIIGSPEITFNNMENNSVCQGEDLSFWISYMFPSLDFELENMVVSIHSIEQRPWNFWRLVKE